MALEIREIFRDDLEQALSLWQSTGDDRAKQLDGVDALRRYLKPNQGLSLIAIEDTRIVGAILCGTADGASPIYAVFVAESHQGRNIERQLIDKALLKLAVKGVRTCNIRVIDAKSDAPLWDTMRWDQVRTIEDEPEPQPDAA